MDEVNNNQTGNYFMKDVNNTSKLTKELQKGSSSNSKNINESILTSFNSLINNNNNNNNNNRIPTSKSYQITSNPDNLKIRLTNNGSNYPSSSSISDDIHTIDNRHHHFPSQTYNPLFQSSSMPNQLNNVLINKQQQNQVVTQAFGHQGRPSFQHNNNNNLSRSNNNSYSTTTPKNSNIHNYSRSSYDSNSYRYNQQFQQQHQQQPQHTLQQPFMHHLQQQQQQQQQQQNSQIITQNNIFQNSSTNNSRHSSLAQSPPTQSHS